MCDYCKVAGHTIQKCYKIHGYPPGHKLYKGRKLAAAVHAESTGVGSVQDMSSQAASVVPPLTSEQYSQLIQLLNKHSSMDNATVGNESIGAAGLMAGKKYCFFTSHTNKVWVIDSGASDHITPDLSLLQDVNPVHIACFITMPNGKQTQIKNIGSMVLAFGLALENVLHIPEFQFNLSVY